MLNQLKALCAAREKATPGLYQNHACPAKCAQVWSESADHPVAYCDTTEMGEGFSEDQQNKNADFFVLAANLDYPRLIAMVERYEAALQKIANRPDLPNPERDADWKNCMKWSAHEAREALAKEKP